MISGLPPQRLYIHPDEQIELLQKQKAEGKTGMPDLDSEREWVLPSHLREKWSLKKFGDVFDSISIVPSDHDGNRLFENANESNSFESEDAHQVVSTEQDTHPSKWRTSQPKRVLLATLDDDSTVVYYIVHDGVVKPRQN